MLRSRLSSSAPIRRRLTSAAVLATTAVLALSSVALSSPAKDDELLKDEQHRLAELKTNDNGTKAGSAWNMEAVGHHSLGDRGFNADVWVHDGFAYVGH